MPYILYGPGLTEGDTLGQSWAGDEVHSNIDLCRQQTISRRFLEKIPKGARVLEAGCGLGRWVFFLRQNGIDAYGVDSNVTAVATAHAYDPSAPIEVGDAENLCQPDGYFDAVVSLGVIEHFEKGPERVLDEMIRVLKPEGKLFVSIPPANLFRTVFTHPLLTLKMRINRLRGRSYAFSEYRFTTKEIRAILKTAGLKIEEEYTDELLPPLSIGLFVDLPQLRDHATNWKLNRIGMILRSLLDALSPKISRGGVLFICSKTGASQK